VFTVWENDDNRFERIYRQGAIRVMEIWVDRVTGVQYLFHADGNGNVGGLTVLLDADGKPVISPERRM